jgi:3-phosphoshikimate 1-carboxyvinyltransferase
VKIRVPGDKSISQRALILATLAQGASRLRGVLAAADPRSTAGALRGLGGGIPPIPDDGGEIVVHGRGMRSLEIPAGPLDLGNSGTGTRLLMGVLAAQPFSAILDGDASLRRRPMGRVSRPLTQMGATFEPLGESADRLPLRVTGGELSSFDYESPVASAQVKSALLLAGLCAGVPVQLTEPGISRDHTERLFRGLGVGVLTHVHTRGVRIEMRDPPASLPPLELDVPGDLSSAAFVILAALLGIAPGPVWIENVGVNPTRNGILDLFVRMGGRVQITEEREVAGEPVASIVASRSDLTAIRVGHAEVTAAIDEIPALAVAAARARGTTRITGAGELRVKETDRIRAMVEGLRAVGVQAEETRDGLEVEGTDAPLKGTVESHHDHRIAMVFGVLGAQRGNHITVRDTRAVDVSFPGFWRLLEALKRGG